MLKIENTPAVAMLKLESVKMFDCTGLIAAGSTVTSSGDENIPVHDAHKLFMVMSDTGIDMENQTNRKYGAIDVHWGRMSILIGYR